MPDDPVVLKAMIAALQAENAKISATLRAHDQLVQALRLRIAKLQKQAFGASSEKIEREIEQLELALEDLLVAVAEAATTPHDEDDAQPSPEKGQNKPRRRPRVSNDTPRERRELDPGHDCPDCGGDLRVELKEDTVTECRRAYMRWWLPLAMDASEPLRRFAHWEHEDIVATFRELDDEVARLTPIEVMRRIRHSLPARDGVPRKSELGVLRHQLGLQRPSMAIRNLLQNLGDTLTKLAPCVLMSPLSIAQYLPAGQATFDIVIFDEASQITTWDAIGAIARGKQSIIVGDPKQLPPTNFFGRSDDGDGDDADGSGMMGDMPSILDEVATAGIPTRRLNWHYRSRDEALIAFSNHFYYDGGLVTFPATTTDSKALQFHKIKGTYARGAGRTNADEAKAIVEMIRQRLSAWLKLPEEDRPTLGVITFNVQQQGLILDLLDQIRRNNPDFEWFFAEEREEPLIVKNLENIQGDERDVMLFSITFAPDLSGKLTMNFGALNSNGGEKRLNVAVTRARSELHVFASLTHDQIDLSRTNATGVRDLKTFLDYAERGAIALPARDEGSLGPAENPFKEAIAAAFRAKGWEVRTQIGVSGFRIDLAVVHPDRAGAYLAGIECDGATYHSSATARDRDKVRQAVLENLGWTILRIWSTDWFRNPTAVVERLNKELENRLEADRKEREEDKAASEQPSSLPNELTALPAPAQDEDETEPVQLLIDSVEQEKQPSLFTETPSNSYQIPETVSDTEHPVADPDRFFDLSYMGELREIVQDILTKESPLPLRNLGRAVAHRHGWQRTQAVGSCSVLRTHLGMRSYIKNSVCRLCGFMEPIRTESHFAVSLTGPFRRFREQKLLRSLMKLVRICLRRTTRSAT